MDLKGTLIEARQKIELEKNWFGGSKPSTDSGQKCMFLVLDSCCGGPEFDLALQALRDVCGGSVIYFNDHHTHAEVLAKFDEAIAKA